MNQRSNSLIFFGNERLASGVTTDAPVLRALIKNGYEVKFVVVSQHIVRGRKSRELEILQIASDNDIEVKSVNKLSEITEDIQNSGATFGVLAAFGKIVPQATIDLFKYGILNLHPSLLPKYRGSSPIEQAVIDNEPTGISIMSLVAEMDAGPTYSQVDVDISKLVKQEAFEKLSSAGASELVKILPSILDGSLSPQEQNPDKATFTSRISKEDGQINWNESAELVERKIRAYAGWPGSTTSLADKDVIITNAAVIHESGEPGKVFSLSKSRFGIYCSSGAIEVLNLKPAGKPEMAAQAFLAGNSIN